VNIRAPSGHAVSRMLTCMLGVMAACNALHYAAPPAPQFVQERLRDLEQLEGALMQRTVSDFQACVASGVAPDALLGMADKAWHAEQQAMCDRHPEWWALYDSPAVTERLGAVRSKCCNIYSSAVIIGSNRHKVVQLLAEFGALVQDTYDSTRSGGVVDETLHGRWAAWGSKAGAEVGFARAECVVAMGLHSALARCFSATEGLKMLESLKGYLCVGSVEVTGSDRTTVQMLWLGPYVRVKWLSEIEGFTFTEQDVDPRMPNLEREVDEVWERRKEGDVNWLASVSSASPDRVRLRGRINCDALDEALAYLSASPRSSTDVQTAWSIARRIEVMRVSQFTSEMMSLELDDPSNTFSIFFWWPPEIEYQSRRRIPNEFFCRAW
jgi:hypothetical protein